MGPIQLDEWGPPMEEIVYILLGKDGEKFSLIYVDQCTKSDDVGFFTKNSRFKCWVSHARTEKNLHVAIYPMFDSSPQSRQNIVEKIISKYRPVCNGKDTEQSSSETPFEKHATDIKCACCGAGMSLEKELEKSNLYKCASCGISDTRLK